MNKTKAKEQARNNTRTWRELLAIVENSNLDGMAKINKNLTRFQAATIMKNMISERKLDEVPKGECYDSFRDRSTISVDGLGIQNLLREFA